MLIRYISFSQDLKHTQPCYLPAKAVYPGSQWLMGARNIFLIMAISGPLELRFKPGD